MMAAKPLAGALLLSAWLLAHAIFIVNANNLLQNSRGQIVDIQQFIPIRLPSVLQLSWFHNLVKHAFVADKLAFPYGTCGVNDCLLYLSWIVSALTLAEWIACTMLFLSAVWAKLIRPVISTIFYVVLGAGLYGCARCCAFTLAPYLPEEVAVSVVRVLVAVDGALLSIWGSLGAFSSWLLWALDGVLSSLVWPSLEDLKSAVAHPNHRSLLNDILVKVKDMAHHLPEAPPHPEF
ncbi:hypothetical protein, conserved [Eimeria acervulina]|uniref:Transmembrane protein n=1 Tax=Eimeria acervulina TaxID=5801 RepID=U6GA79_EIMAC|nr:hypothetical protein, conserved [Eimeria acervulina]CDI76248.1 hypothetical protein, conserved [Eimeria acervulina]